MVIRAAAVALACGLALTLVSGLAHAQYPVKTVRIVVASAPGATTDIVARTLGQKLSENIGQPVVVDNRPGAGGNVAAELVAKAAPDGYTLLLGFPGLATNPFLYEKLNYDPVKDLAPIALACASPLMLVIHPALPAKSTKELIALAKARPGDMHFASVGAGTSSHLSSELFKAMAGVNMVHVPYKNFGQAMIDLTAGRLSLMINAFPGLLPHVKAGKLRPLAVTTLKRTALMPELPTISESALPGYEVTTWNGILAPAATPREIVTRLNTEIVKSLRAPDTLDQLSKQGLEVVASTPEAFGRYIQTETVKWAKVIKTSGAKLD